MSSKKPLVLLAEDDTTISQMFSTYLKEEGFDIINAYDGEETLKLIKERRPVVVLLDLMMPKLSGFTVMEEVKKDPSLSSISILVFSNLGQSSDIDKSKEMGAKDYLVKADLTPDQVAAKIKQYL